MAVLKRYYIRQTGYSNGIATGQVLNRDGSVYTGDMSKDDKPEYQRISHNAPILAVDKFDVRITGNSKQQKVHILVLQDRDVDRDNPEVVAALQCSPYELADLRDEIDRAIRDFKSKEGVVQLENERP
ncbi:MAG TPA: hypothetical protein VKQ34_04450 [Candidatus Saccharimonadales bacterium]|nr:hypothetical protein [Candidatus Saccharimonadales bacterium]